MRIFTLEIKKIIKTRVTWILLLAALALSVLMAYLPVTFEGLSYKAENGERVQLSGLAAIHYAKDAGASLSGAVTAKKIQTAVGEYQEALREYGVEDSFELPEDVYYDRLMIYQPFIHGVKEVFSDEKTGMAPGLLDIDPEEVGTFYERAPIRLENLMRMEGSRQSDIDKAEEMYRKIETPFQYYEGVSGNSMDYQVLTIFLLTIICAVIVSPVFSMDYQTGADDILRCTKHGRLHLAVFKILAALVITGVTFLLCGVLWILTTNTLFGWESTKTSMQMLFSVSSLPALTIGELEWTNLLGSFLLFFSLMSLILFLSARIRNAAVALAAAMFFCILPIITYIGAPETLANWLQCLLPGGALGLNNSLLYAMTELDFLHPGGLSVWNVHLMFVIVARQVVISKNAANRESLLQILFVFVITLIAVLFIFKKKVPEL